MGLVAFDDSVKKYIPEYPFENITIFHLMTHTAGYEGGYGIDWPKDKNEFGEFFNKIYGINKMDHKPGEAALYFSYGYSILLDIIERVTGRKIEDFAREILFDPLNMVNTTYDVTKLNNKTCIMPYDEEKGCFHDYFSTPPTGDSGLYSTAQDLLKFAKIFLDAAKNKYEIFSQPAYKFMVSNVGTYSKTPIFWIKENRDIYGCFGDINSSAAVAHTGFSGCMLLIDTAYDVAIAIVTNSMKMHADWSNYKRICNLLLTME